MARRFLIRFVAVLAMGIAPLASTGRAAPEPAEARRFILDGVARAIEILKSHHLPREEIAHHLRAELRHGFDVPAMAAMVLGSARRGMNGNQMRRYVHEFEELIVQTYTSRVLRFGPRVKSDIRDIIKITGTRPADGDELIVRSEVNRSGAQWVKIDWRVHEKDGRIRITDVVILGISQVQLYRSEFASVIRQSGRGVEGLIAALRQKNEALRSE